MMHGKYLTQCWPRVSSWDMPAIIIDVCVCVTFCLLCEHLGMCPSVQAWSAGRAAARPSAQVAEFLTCHCWRALGKPGAPDPQLGPEAGGKLAWGQAHGRGGDVSPHTPGRT